MGRQHTGVIPSGARDWVGVRSNEISTGRLMGRSFAEFTLSAVEGLRMTARQ